jgi:uncharacterized protein DUF6636
MYPRSFRFSITAVAACVTATVVSSVALGAGTAPRFPSFKSPSGNIVCGHSARADREAYVACGIKTGLRPAPRNTCVDLDYSGKRMSLRAAGSAVIDLCAGDPGPFVLADTAPVLGYGSKWSGGGIVCSSRRTGVTCTNRSGHGFFMSRGHSYRF